ncbi:transamidase GatB domain-containing protein [Methylophaga lonarensis MPL]|uniref:Transamidase GatB domain-containing protein n=1 Tax=Methylophaga lonarensis MPL TaxID=1286106 RepID=M7P3B1_9GAMM|nr:GatB/YqeY domain-containing protein [Methylophaga lonarensis]EMR14002.1 transamidase GatB domain-containing protein [Methylophaga lonarensis MPL]MCC5796128.1 GatB/YqeY domain-containing protein [Methylophaga sp.]
MPQEASPLKTRIQDDVKDAMRAKAKDRLGALRQITAAIKQAEVDNRADLSDDDVIAILTKMGKQRKEALEQYEKAGREDLASIERAELVIIEEFLPAQMDEAEIQQAVQNAIEQVGASSVRDMGAVMNILRPQMQGRADMSLVSNQVKSALNG